MKSVQDREARERADKEKAAILPHSARTTRSPWPAFKQPTLKILSKQTAAETSSAKHVRFNLLPKSANTSRTSSPNLPVASLKSFYVGKIAHILTTSANSGIIAEVVPLRKEYEPSTRVKENDLIDFTASPGHFFNGSEFEKGGLKFTLENIVLFRGDQDRNAFILRRLDHLEKGLYTTKLSRYYNPPLPFPPKSSVSSMSQVLEEQPPSRTSSRPQPSRPAPPIPFTSFNASYTGKGKGVDRGKGMGKAITHAFQQLQELLAGRFVGKFSASSNSISDIMSFRPENNSPIEKSFPQLLPQDIIYMIAARDGTIKIHPSESRPKYDIQDQAIVIFRVIERTLVPKYFAGKFDNLDESAKYTYKHVLSRATRTQDGHHIPVSPLRTPIPSPSPSIPKTVDPVSSTFTGTKPIEGSRRFSTAPSVSGYPRYDSDLSRRPSGHNASSGAPVGTTRGR